MPPCVKEPFFEPELTRRCRFEAIRTIVRFVYGKHARANVRQLSMELLHILARVVDNDSDTDTRTCAMTCLGNIAYSATHLVLVDNEIVACALRVVQEQGNGAPPPPPPSSPPSPALGL
jgi:hypothetical protein